MNNINKPFIAIDNINTPDMCDELATEEKSFIEPHNTNRKDSLGDRMKEYYENVYRIKLTRRTPAIIRIDMRAGHSFTRGFKKPYDIIFFKSMVETAIRLCEEIQNTRLAYIQSDEISLLLTDYTKLTTEQWFTGNIQKMASVSASIATSAFNKAYMHIILEEDILPFELEKYTSRINTMTFDSRVFNIPESEVVNYFIWRQQDATRNSIESAGHAIYSPKELYKKNCNQIQDMLMDKGINWNNYPNWYKRGLCIVKNQVTEDDTIRSRWQIDYDIPIFIQDRAYISQYIGVSDEQ